MNIHTLKSVPLILVSVLFAFVAAYYLSSQIAPLHTAEAQSVSFPASLEGFAWSSNIGWISFSCNNATQVRSDQTHTRWDATDAVVSNYPSGTCSSVSYGVSIDASGNLNGYAWSDNVGWIKFGGLSSFPAANGNTAVNARLVAVGGDYELQGWARACAGTTSGDCSTMASRTDGWDGWISLKGTADDGGTYRVLFQGGQAAVANANTSMWGGAVMGWIKANAGVAPLTIVETPAISSFTATPDELELGGDVDLEWTIQGMTSCTASNNRSQSDWSGSVGATSGTHNQPVTPPQNTTIYTLSCVGTDGTTYTETATVISRPNLQITALSVSPTLPAPSADGTYDGVEFLADVAGLSGSMNPSYRFTFAGQTLTGTVSWNGVRAVFSPVLEVDNVVFGTYNARLEVDLPAPGSIAEDLPSTGVNEDVQGNSRDLNNVDIPPPPPEMTIAPDRDTVRSGESTLINVEVTSSFAADCRLDGNGISEIFTTSGDYMVPFTQDYPTPDLTSTSVYLLQCTEPVTGIVFTEEARIEVIPNIEEI